MLRDEDGVHEDDMCGEGKGDGSRLFGTKRARTEVSSAGGAYTPARLAAVLCISFEGALFRRDNISEALDRFGVAMVLSADDSVFPFAWRGSDQEHEPSAPEDGF